MCFVQEPLSDLSSFFESAAGYQISTGNINWGGGRVPLLFPGKIPNGKLLAQLRSKSNA